MKYPKPRTPAQKYAALRFHQNNYVNSIGGSMKLKKGDSIYNKLSRLLLASYAKVYPQAFVGNLTLFGQERSDFIDGKTSSMTEYRAENVCDFGCDFVVPTQDPVLDDLLREYLNTWQEPKPSFLAKVIARIYELGGELLLWT